jgi:FMN phosphatase YigB (HAD superfamily)
MKIIFFDLGDTLETNDVLLPGALDTLRGVQNLQDSGGKPPVLGLISDFDSPSEEYYAILDQLGIRSFFEPVQTRVTLSSEVGVFKPDRRIFRAALDRIDPALTFGDAMFITENPAHVAAAGLLGLRAVRFMGQLPDLIPLIGDFLAA